MKKLVLAYSGGLDTSYCAVYLSRDLGYEVHAVGVNTGGFSKDEISAIKEKAVALGAASCEVIDATTSYYEKVVKYLIFGNVLRNNTYPLSVSAERIIQALEIVNYAKSIGASHIAHGSTGAGNDQVRFDMIFKILAPDMDIITPIRDQGLSREEEVAFLDKNGINWPWEKAQYSINKGLWGTSVGGSETLSSHLPLPETAYPSGDPKQGHEKLTVAFNKGEITAVNGEAGDPVGLIEKLNQLGAAYGIGRDIHVGDTIIGIKGRVGFEAPAALMAIKAHHLLEKHVLSKWQLFQKDQLANFYGMMLHEGQYLDPVMRNIEAFFTDSQLRVSGQVFLTLYPYRFTLDGIQSDNDLMKSEFGNYGEDHQGWTADDAKGFIHILSNAGRITHNNK